MKIGHIFWVMWASIVWAKYYPDDIMLTDIVVGVGVAVGSIWQLWNQLKKYIKLPV